MVKKIIMVAVMVALFAGAVGVGVHVLNKEARANITYSVNIIEMNRDAEVVGPLAGCTVMFKFDGGDWEMAEEIADGFFSITRDNACQWGWKAWITDPDIDLFAEPMSNPCNQNATILSFDWFVVPDWF